VFHTSLPQLLLHNHKLFPKVDWERVDAGNYAVVDPVNPGVILYLSEQDYIVMVRVAITSNRTLKVLAAPGETPDASSTTSSNDTSQNSPTSQWGEILNLGNQTSTGSRGRTRFLNLWRTILQKFLSKSKVSNSTQMGVTGVSMIGLTSRNVRQWFHTWHDLLSWWSRGSVPATVQIKKGSKVKLNKLSKEARLDLHPFASFGIFLYRILRSNGVNHLIARLKIMLFVVNSYLGGRKLESTQALGFRIKLANGLPAALPHIVRHGIRYGNKHYIHIWTSVLFSYKGILGTWKEPNLAIGSIPSPPPEIQERLLDHFRSFVTYFWQNIRAAGAPAVNLKVRGTFFSTHAGPNHPNTLLGAGFDAYLWEAMDRFGFRKDPKTGAKVPIEANSLVDFEHSWKLLAIREVTGVARNYIREWLTATGQADLWMEIRKTAKMFALNHELLRNVRSSNDEFQIISGEGVAKPAFSSQYLFHIFGLNTALYRFKNPTLQRLHNLYEAAGKVRTIAIVDYWTNFVLKPLHDWMFEILQLLPQDATFDQEGRVREFAERGYTELFSYDLKSATDLIPLILYKILLGGVVPEKIVGLWSDLMVNRNFLVPKSTLKEYPSHPRRIRYCTGQPMGALTSWASMALVHHAIVLYASLRCGITKVTTLLTFRDYMVLGDDVVIANALVAKTYVLICKEFGIPLSLSKSHISDAGLFNFANQTFVKNRNVSPVSLREEVNCTSLPERAELALRMARRGWFSLTSQGWLTPLVKKFLRPDIYAHVVTENRHRRVPPVIRWILAVILTPGTSRYGFTGIGNVSLETFLGVQLRKGDLWRSRMTRTSDYIKVRTQGLLVSILGKWSNAVYGEFLRSRKRLEDAVPWAQKVVSVDLEWLFIRIFEEARKAAMQRWIDKYRIPLKEIQVCCNLSRFTIHDVEIGTGREWTSLVAFVAEAEAALPVIPDFHQDVLETLVGLRGGGTEAKQLRNARESFLRVTTMLGMIDHLDLHRTPGFTEAWENSQSSDSKPENKSPI